MPEIINEPKCKQTGFRIPRGVRCKFEEGGGHQHVVEVKRRPAAPSESSASAEPRWGWEPLRDDFAEMTSGGAPGGSPADEGMKGSSRHSDERALLVEQIAALHEEYPDMARVLNSLTRAERIARDRCSPGQESGDNAWAMYVAHGSPMRCRECNKPAPCPTVALVRSFATPGDDRG